MELSLSSTAPPTVDMPCLPPVTFIAANKSVVFCNIVVELPLPLLLLLLILLLPPPLPIEPLCCPGPTLLQALLLLLPRPSPPPRSLTPSRVFFSPLLLSNLLYLSNGRLLVAQWSSLVSNMDISSSSRDCEIFCVDLCPFIICMMDL